ncbi:MAG: glycosyltransferase [candidate division NC10 bacterium]|nr:glycosyltransferase [candidate division NC10 bacterium]
MRIVFATARNPHFPTITEYVEGAIRALGHETVPFDDRAFALPGRLRAAVPLVGRLDLARLNRRLVETVRRTRPSILLCAGGERIFPGTIEAARRAGVVTALWTIDPVKPADPRIALAPHFDFVFCGGTEMIEALRHAPLRRPACWLPFACDPDLHRSVPLSSEEQHRYGHDIAFVGSLHADMYPNRIEMLEALADLDLAIWGPGAQELGNPGLRRKVRGAEARHEVWTRVYSASRIVLCAHYAGPGPQSHQASPRVYEALACGAFLLCDDRKDVRALFQDGVDLSIFKDPAALRHKALHYLAHETERDEVARHGQATVLASHTYSHRVRRLLETLGQA